MGAANVALVFRYFGDLDHAPHRLLTYMALTCLDDDEPPRFWGGREALAGIALGRRLPAEPARGDKSDAAQEARRARRAAFEAVNAGMRQLREAGAIRLVSSGAPGRRSEYHLHLQREGMK